AHARARRREIRRSPPRGRDGRSRKRVSAGRDSYSGWGGRIRTFEYGIQSPAPYRLATPHHPLWIRGFTGPRATATRTAQHRRQTFRCSVSRRTALTCLRDQSVDDTTWVHGAAFVHLRKTVSVHGRARRGQFPQGFTPHQP